MPDNEKGLIVLSPRDSYAEIFHKVEMALFDYGLSICDECDEKSDVLRFRITPLAVLTFDKKTDEPRLVSQEDYRKEFGIKPFDPDWEDRTDD